MTSSSSKDIEKIGNAQALPTETTKIDILNPRDLMRRFQESTKNNDLLVFIQQTITLDHDISRGLEETELKELINDTQERTVRDMLQRLSNLKEGEDLLLATTEERENHIRYSWLVKGERIKGGKFDVIVIRATQAKQVDKSKLMAAGVASGSVGLILGTALGLPLGVFAGSAMFGATALKITSDLQKSHPDLIYGYIIKDLCDKQLLSFPSIDTYGSS